MNEIFDVIIAGAGPAGAQCARDLAARDYDVLLLEAEEEEDFPRQSNKSTGGSFPSMLSAFGIPDDVVMRFTNEVVLESPNEYFVRSQPGAVLEFAQFKQFLVNDAERKGAELRFDARVSNPITDGEAPVGVQYDGDREVYGEVIVDATGPAAPLAKKLGVVELKRGRQAIGIEHEFEGVNLDADGWADLRDTMMLRLDHDLAPGGYSWIFHTGADTAKVGVCYIQNERHNERAEEGMTIDGYLDYWLDTDPRLQDASRIEGKTHRGSAHIQKPDGLSRENFVAIGDTVPTVDPVWGEGIHKGMKSARAAAKTIDHCLTLAEPDTSAEEMAIYDDLWHSEVAPGMDSRLLMTELLYFAPNDRYDTLMQDLNRLDNNTLREANDGSKLAMAKLLHPGDLPMLAQFGRSRLADGAF